MPTTYLPESPAIRASHVSLFEIRVQEDQDGSFFHVDFWLERGDRQLQHVCRT